jgi:DNA-binding PadR family transcriptional regulator
MRRKPRSVSGGVGSGELACLQISARQDIRVGRHLCRRLDYDSLMASFATGDTSPRMLALGLVVQQEDTVKGINRRMSRRFSSARFTRGSAHKYLPSLATEDLVQLVERGFEPSLDRYAATEKGEAYFGAWLHQTELPPAVRDALQCKLEFFELDDIPALIEAVHEQEEAFTAATDIAHERLQREQQARRASGETDWRRELRRIKSKDAARLGGLMAERLQALREELEELEERAPQAKQRARREVGGG